MSCDKPHPRRVQSIDVARNEIALAARGRRGPLDGLYTVRMPSGTETKTSMLETACVADSRTGRADALERLYREYHGCIYALCYRMLGNAEDTQDAAQAAFVRAFRGLASFRGESGLKTWIYRIAVNEAVSTLRRRRRRPEIFDVEPAGGATTDSIPEREAIWAALRRVKPDHRTILILRFWEDLEYEEIAKVLGISLAAMKMRLLRARQEFQKWYETI